jgi:integrase
MASIHKHSSGRSPFWFAKYRDESNRVVIKSTKQTDRKSAQAIADAWERVAELARRKQLGKDRFLEIASDTLQRIGASEVSDITVEKHFETWIEGKKASTSEGSLARYTSTKKQFLEYLGTKRNHSMSVVSKGDIQGFINHRIKTGSAPKTAIVDFKILNNAFSNADNVLMFRNPCKGVQLPKPKRSTRGTFTAGQIRLLLDASPSDDWKTMIMLGYYTGQRLQDCALQKWESIDLDRGLLISRPSKTAHHAETDEEAAHPVPIHSDLLEYLMSIATDTPGFLCPSLAGKESGGVNGLSRQFAAIVKSAGIDAATAKGKGARMFTKLSFHSLRHSLNSAMADAGVSQEIRMKIMGHSSAAVNTGYTHIDLEPLRAAIAKLPGLK